MKLPPRSPHLNAHAERFVRTIKEPCLERMIVFGEASLRTAVQNFVEHYNRERAHQCYRTKGRTPYQVFLDGVNDMPQERVA